MAHFEDHSDVHFMPGSPITVSTVSSPDSFLLWSTFTKSSELNCTTGPNVAPSRANESSDKGNSGRGSSEQMKSNCTSFGLLSMSLEANSNFKFKPHYDSVLWWKREQIPAQKGFSSSELLSKWKSASSNDQNVFLEPNMYEVYNVDGDMGNSDRSINLEDRKKRRRKKRSRGQEHATDEDEDGDGISKRARRMTRVKRQSLTSNGKRSKSIEKNERGFSTGSLIAKDNPLDGSDVIFATWWQPMKTLDTLVLSMDTLIESCIRRYSDPQTAQKMKQSMKDIQQLMPTDYLQTVKKFCRERVTSTQKHASPASASSSSSSGASSTYSQATWQEDLVAHKLGQFTLYRLNLTCANGLGGKGPKIAPITGQIWPEANGWIGSSIVRAVSGHLYH